ADHDSFLLAGIRACAAPPRDVCSRSFDPVRRLPDRQSMRDLENREMSSRCAIIGSLESSPDEGSTGTQAKFGNPVWASPPTGEEIRSPLIHYALTRPKDRTCHLIFACRLSKM